MGQSTGLASETKLLVLCRLLSVLKSAERNAVRMDARLLPSENAYHNLDL